MIRILKSGITHQATANQFGLELSDVQTLLQSQTQLEKISTSENSRKNLELGDKLRILHLYQVQNINLKLLAYAKYVERLLSPYMTSV